MWLLFHRNAKTRTVPGGATFVETCPECHRRATFAEVELTENFGVFFVDLIGDRERAYRCGACGEVFDLKDRAPAPASPDPLGEVAAPRREDPELAAERRRAAAVKIEDELADLKKRMGR